MEEEIITIEEKQQMIGQFIRNLSYNKYNVELSLLAENAVDNPNQNNIDSFTIQLKEIEDKLAVLYQELDKIGE